MIPYRETSRWKFPTHAHGKGKTLFVVSGVKLSGDCLENHVRKGYVPVLVGKDAGMMERLHVPTKLMGHPFVAALVELLANEFGYEQQGLLRIPYDSDCFKQKIRRISKKK
ncbi:hypothetical protein BT93_L3549 [Corymbia citriodora subsp. variegata]|uniref:Uncharacterized protein n=1 Tax=Corymbia citriodora subsp. variegata TaxID=360336 RepID=A0A8T0CI75_CORYI|nr:hypothetical protein BT93_L3549 [Corymbia citriodora subsp. variegata]